VVIDREHILWSNLFGKLQNHCAQLEMKMVMTVISISVLFRLFIYCAHTARVGYKQCLVSTIPIKLLVSKVCANIVFVFVYGKSILNKILPKKKKVYKNIIKGVLKIPDHLLGACVSHNFINRKTFWEKMYPTYIKTYKFSSCRLQKKEKFKEENFYGFYSYQKQFSLNFKLLSMWIFLTLFFFANFNLKPIISERSYHHETLICVTLILILYFIFFPLGLTFFSIIWNMNGIFREFILTCKSSFFFGIAMEFYGNLLCKSVVYC
jgi:hypothetical protein